MRAYSVDLRERIVAAVSRGQPKSVVAQQFGVGRATVARYVRQHQTTGDLRPKPIPGAQPLIGTDQHAALTAQLAAHPDSTLAEHCTTWEQTQGVWVSIDTMRRAIARVHWRRKKRPSLPASRTPARGQLG